MRILETDLIQYLAQKFFGQANLCDISNRGEELLVIGRGH